MTEGYGSTCSGCSAMDTNITRADKLKETTRKTFDDGWVKVLCITIITFCFFFKLGLVFRRTEG